MQKIFFYFILVYCLSYLMVLADNVVVKTKFYNKAISKKNFGLLDTNILCDLF